MKRCQKMKWRQRAHLGSMGMKRVMSIGQEKTSGRGKGGDDAS
jgi:hypothetical protein